MAKYRKKPVVVEAVQFTQDDEHGFLYQEKPLPEGVKYYSESFNKGFRVITIHGQNTKVIVGDWIITEPDGIHHYPCKPDIFEATYEPVETDTEVKE